MANFLPAPTSLVLRCSATPTLDAHGIWCSLRPGDVRRVEFFRSLLNSTSTTLESTKSKCPSLLPDLESVAIDTQQTDMAHRIGRGSCTERFSLTRRGTSCPWPPSWTWWMVWPTTSSTSFTGKLRVSQFPRASERCQLDPTKSPSRRPVLVPDSIPARSLLDSDFVDSRVMDLEFGRLPADVKIRRRRLSTFRGILYAPFCGLRCIRACYFMCTSCLACDRWTGTLWTRSRSRSTPVLHRASQWEPGVPRSS